MAKKKKEDKNRRKGAKRVEDRGGKRRVKDTERKRKTKDTGGKRTRGGKMEEEEEI